MQKQLLNEIETILYGNCSNINVKDNDILLLKGITPLQLSSVLIELEKKYLIEIYDEHILGNEFDTINNILCFVEKNRKDINNV